MISAGGGTPEQLEFTGLAGSSHDLQTLFAWVQFSVNSDRKVAKMANSIQVRSTVPIRFVLGLMYTSASLGVI